MTTTVNAKLAALAVLAGAAAAGLSPAFAQYPLKVRAAVVAAAIVVSLAATFTLRLAYLLARRLIGVIRRVAGREYFTHEDAAGRLLDRLASMAGTPASRSSLISLYGCEVRKMSEAASRYAGPWARWPESYAGHLLAEVGLIARVAGSYMALANGTATLTVDGDPAAGLWYQLQNEQDAVLSRSTLGTYVAGVLYVLARCERMAAGAHLCSDWPEVSVAELAPEGGELSV